MFNSEDCGPAGQSQGVVHVCTTCLATDRALFSLQETPQYVNICDGLTIKRVLSTGIQCLSTLTRTVSSPCDTIHIDGHSQVKLEVSEPDAEVKPERLEFTAEPLTVLMNKRLKTERKQITSEDPMAYTKAELRDDEIKDTPSEDREPQIEDPFITMHFTAQRMELNEVLTHMERTRNSPRYQRARYKCRRCAQTFTTEPQHRLHRERHGENRSGARCDVCGQRYKHAEALKRHTAIHFTRYSCRHCARSCFSYSQMYFHYRNVHDENTRRPCGKCPASFTSHRELTQHRHRAHGRKYPCPRCERQYATSVGLQRHSFVHDASVPELECDICHKKYKGECNLKAHIRNVHELKPGDAYCVECDVQFKDPHQYRLHLSTSRHVSAEDYKYECGHCGKRFTQKPTLMQHVEVTHLKLSKYKCDVCDERFHTKRYAVNHMRRKHSNEPRGKKHDCQICAKAFTVRKSLDEHMNAHLGVRPFECKLCGATFAYNSALYNHNQLVHLKKVRKCRNT